MKIEVVIQDVYIFSVSNIGRPDEQSAETEILTALYRAEQLYGWLTNDREYVPLRFMGLLHLIKEKSQEDPDYNLLDEVQEFIRAQFPQIDVHVATQRAAEKSKDFERIVDEIEARTVGDVAKILESGNYRTVEEAFRKHVQYSLNKVLKMKKEPAKPNVFEHFAPRGVKTIRNDDKKK